MSEDRIFLKQSEAKVSLDVALKEQKQARELIDKYHYPYLKSRVIELHKLYDRLEDTIGPLGKILEQYRLAMKALVVSLESFEDVRMVDSMILVPLDYMANEKLPEISSVNKTMDRIMDGLQRAVRNRLVNFT